MLSHTSNDNLPDSDIGFSNIDKIKKELQWEELEKN